MEYRLLTDVDNNRTYVIHDKTGLYFKYCYPTPSWAKIVLDNLNSCELDRDMEVNHVNRQPDVMLVSGDSFGEDSREQK